MSDTTNISGDYIHGDKFLGDNVIGDKIIQAPQPDPPPLPPLDQLAAWAAFHALPDAVPSAPAPALPAGSRMTLTPNPLFAGRGDELRDLAAALKRGGTTVISTGIGGVGKTTLAIECAWRYAPFFPGGVFWLSSADEQSLRSEIAACGAASALALQGGFASRTLDEQVALVLREWAHDLPRLLVFDNCEDPKLLRAYRPRGGGCRILATSRNAVWEPSLGVTPVALDVLPLADAKALLHNLCPRLTDDEAKDVAEALGRLPLALHLAGSYLKRYRTDVKTYLVAMNSDDALEHAALTGRGVRDKPTDRDMHVARAFALSFVKLQPNESIDAAALALLARAARLAPGEPFPQTLLEATLAVAKDDENATLDRADGLLHLLELGLLERAGDNTLRLHRLLARFALRAVVDADALAAVAIAVRNAASAVNSSGYIGPMQPLLPHLRHLADDMMAHEDERAALLLNAYGYYLHSSGNFVAARIFYEQALAIWTLIFGPVHPAIALSLSNLGALLQAQGNLAEARLYMDRALGIREKALGLSHPDTILILNNLGALLQLQGDLIGARLSMERTLEIREQTLSPIHLDIARSLNNLGYLLLAQGDLVRAHPYLERALAIRQQVLGFNHPDTAGSLNNLGLLLQGQGDLTRARPYFERALAIWKQVFGPTHPDTAQGFNNLAFLLYREGSIEEAIPLMEQAVAIYMERLGEAHPDTQNAKAGLAVLRERVAQQSNDPLVVLAPLMAAIAALARGDGGVDREGVEATLTKLQANGFMLVVPTERVWAGERDAAALTVGLDATDAALVRQVLAALAKDEG